MKVLSKRNLSYLLVALFGLSLSACATYDDHDEYGHETYEEGYYDESGEYHSHTHRRSSRSQRRDPYYDSRYDRYYDPYYDRYYSRYPNAYYDPFYSRYYYYGAGSYGSYGYYRRGHGYYCPVHSGYYSRTHYNSRDHRAHGESVRDRNARIEPNTGPVMDSNRRGGSRSTNSDTRRDPRNSVRTPRSGIDGVISNGTRSSSSRSRNRSRNIPRSTTTPATAPETSSRRRDTSERASDQQIRERIAQIRAQQAAEGQRSPRRVRQPRNEVEATPRQNNEPRSDSRRQSEPRSSRSRTNKSERRNRNMH